MTRTAKDPKSDDNITKSASQSRTPDRNSAEEIESWLDGIEDDPSVEVFDGAALRDIATARTRTELAEEELRSAVSVARAEGHSWAAIGAVLGGVSRQAAQQRFG
jgi:tellurite resistance protein